MKTVALCIFAILIGSMFLPTASAMSLEKFVVIQVGDDSSTLKTINTIRENVEDVKIIRYSSESQYTGQVQIYVGHANEEGFFYDNRLCQYEDLDKQCHGYPILAMCDSSDAARKMGGFGFAGQIDAEVAGCVISVEILRATAHVEEADSIIDLIMTQMLEKVVTPEDPLGDWADTLDFHCLVTTSSLLGVLGGMIVVTLVGLLCAGVDPNVLATALIAYLAGYIIDTLILTPSGLRGIPILGDLFLLAIQALVAGAVQLVLAIISGGTVSAASGGIGIASKVLLKNFLLGALTELTIKDAIVPLVGMTLQLLSFFLGGNDFTIAQHIVDLGAAILDIFDSAMTFLAMSEIIGDIATLMGSGSSPIGAVLISTLVANAASQLMDAIGFLFEHAFNNWESSGIFIDFDVDIFWELIFPLNVRINPNNAIIALIPPIFDLGFFLANFGIDVIAPTISGITHNPSAPYTDQNVCIYATVTDASGVGSVILHYYKGSVWYTATMSASGSQYSYNLGKLPAGTLQYYITASDNAPLHNAATSATKAISVIADISGPSIYSIQYPSTAIKGSTITITGLVTDRAGVSGVWLYYNTGSGWKYVSMSCSSGYIYSISMTFLWLSMSFYIYAKDNLGNAAASSTYYIKGIASLPDPEYPPR